MYLANTDENIIDAKAFRLEGADLIKMTEAEKEALAKEQGKNQKDEGF
jgi:hypothetical protein